MVGVGLQDLTRAGAHGWPRYRLFGLTLASNFAFQTHLPTVTDAPDLGFVCTADAPAGLDLAQPSPDYCSPYRDQHGEPALSIYRLPGRDLLRFADAVDFHLYPDFIHCHVRDPETAFWVEIRLLGVVLSFWMERQQIPMLHCAATVVDGLAAGFLASNQGGKSSLAAALMQAGYPLLTDDILPIETAGQRFVGRPGYPSTRFWPAAAEHFLGRSADLPQVHPDLSKRRVSVVGDGLGGFWDRPAPIGCLYLPERYDRDAEDAPVEITPFAPAAALMELLRHSFIVRPVQALGWQPRRLALLSRLVQQVPLRRLRYPSGFEHLPRVRAAVLADRGHWAGGPGQLGAS